MPLRLFGYEPKRISLDAIGTSDRFRHSFGGTHEDYGIRFKNADPPLHVIYWLNLLITGADFDGRHIAFATAVPFCLRHELWVLHRLHNEVTFYRHHDELCPPWNAPRYFHAKSTSFTLEAYTPQDPVDALNYKGVFGWEELTDVDRDSAIRIAVEKYRISPDEGLTAIGTWKILSAPCTILLFDNCSSNTGL